MPQNDILEALAILLHSNIVTVVSTCLLVAVLLRN